MSDMRLSKAETRALLAKALLERERRRTANAKAREAREAQGLKRLEKWVPAVHVAELRRLVAAFLAGVAIDQNPVFIPRGPTETVAQAMLTPLPRKSEPPTSYAAQAHCDGTGKRAQNARRRARKQASGLVRTTFDVPAAMAPRVSSLVDQIVFWLSQGVAVVLSETVAMPAAEAFQLVSPPIKKSSRALDDGPVGGHEVERPFGASETSPLFEDIHAVARLKRAD